MTTREKINAAIAQMTESELEALAQLIVPSGDIVAKAIAVSGGSSALARRLGVTPQAIQNWRKGIRTPRPAMLQQLQQIAAGSKN